jgi:hypothetical protein
MIKKIIENKIPNNYSVTRLLQNEKRIPFLKVKEKFTAINE